MSTAMRNFGTVMRAGGKLVELTQGYSLNQHRADPQLHLGSARVFTPC